MGYTFDPERVHSALFRLSDRVGSEAAVKAVVAGLTRRGVAACAATAKDGCGHFTRAVEVNVAGRRITICCPCY